MATRPLTDEKTILTLKIKQAYSQWSTQQINSKRDKIWTDICENLKTHSKRRIIIAKYDTHIADLDNRINARKAKLSKIWGGMIPANTVQNRDANPIPSKKRKRADDTQTETDVDDKPKKNKKRRIYTPAQNNIRNEIAAKESKIAGLTCDLRRPFVKVDEIQGAINDENDLIVGLKKKLKRLQNNAEAQQKRTANKNEKLKIYNKEHPEDTNFIVKDAPGRPNVERYFPHFGSVLMDIVNEFCATDPKRRSEQLTYCDSLASFTSKVNEMGFDINQQTLYLRLIPRRKSSIHGRTHIRTIPVKLAKPQEDDHGKHPSQRFCLAQCRQNKQIASLLGPTQCVYLGIDDKCKVPLDDKYKTHYYMFIFKRFGDGI
eukprot:748759_1